MLKVIRMSSQQDWHIPFHEDAISLQAALDSVPPATAMLEMPLMLRLQRDPVLSFLGQLVFRAGLDQHQHDCIHVLLGRGLLAMDQAFALGFTLGSSKKGSMPEHKLHGEVGRHFYKNTALFGETESVVFKDGIKLAYLSFCAPLDRFNFKPWHNHPLRQVREAIGLEPELFQAYFAVEKHRFPHSVASQRLLPKNSQLAAN
jgi:hypothetical protein